MGFELLAGEYWYARRALQLCLGAIYGIAFLNAYLQFPALCGSDGLQPIQNRLQRHSFQSKPSLFHWYYSDTLLRAVALAGMVISLLCLTPWVLNGPIWLYLTCWILLWVLYQSIVNVGGLFYGFGWESMLLEFGFYAIFLLPGGVATPFLTILMIRWMLFRVEFGAGLIKMRGDACWQNLTCMEHHHETQPLPNPLSWFFHHAPRWFHKLETGGNHLVQLVIIWGLFLPQPYAAIAALLIMASQAYLIASGNYSWLNVMTLTLGFSGFSDGVVTSWLGLSAPAALSLPFGWHIALLMLAFLIVVLSIKPVINMLSSSQKMNFSFNPLHLVNTYGAFGSVTRKRYEIVLEATQEQEISENTEWYAYTFRGKPTDPHRMPPQVAPYHLRLDWQMWFAALRPSHVPGWLDRMVEKLLAGDRQTEALFKQLPFEDPPSYIRGRLFRYRYSDWQELREEGLWWRREEMGTYLPPRSS